MACTLESAMSSGYAGFASDLPPDRIVFRSAEENEETMRRWGVTQETRQLGTGPFRCDMAVRSTPFGDLYSDRFNVATSMRLEPPAGMVGIMVLRSAGGPIRASGESAANDRLVVVPDGCGVDIVTSELGGSDALTLPKASFAALSEAICPTMDELLPRQTQTIRGAPHELAALRKLLVEQVACPDRDPRHEMLSDLLAALVAWMGSANRVSQPEHSTNRGRVAKQARDYIEAHFRDPVRMEDLCRVTGVGARCVQKSFRRYFDLTITDYLKTVRLADAHRALAAAHPSAWSVTEVAGQAGFGHLGRFSVEYRARFGESPSATLARRRG